MEIRKARIVDAPQLAKLQHELLSYHIRFDDSYKFKPDLEKQMTGIYKKIIYSKNKKIFVAEIDGKLVGYVYGKIIRRPKIFCNAYIGWMEGTVTKKHRRKRIGETLTNELFKWYKKKHIDRVELATDCHNDLGLSAWRKFGFKDYQIRMKKEI